MNLFWRACEVLSVAQGDPCFLSPTRPRKPMGHPSEYGAAEPQGPIPIKITGLVCTHRSVGFTGQRWKLTGAEKQHRHH